MAALLASLSGVSSFTGRPIEVRCVCAFGVTAGTLVAVFCSVIECRERSCVWFYTELQMCCKVVLVLHLFFKTSLFVLQRHTAY